MEMATFAIDDKTVQAPAGSNLLEAARQNGIPIPEAVVKDLVALGKELGAPLPQA